MKDVALDFVLGALSPIERREVDEARRIDLALDREIDALEAQLSPLTGAAGEVAPPPALYDRIAAAIARQDCEHRGKYSETVTEGRWLRYRPGIEAKRLRQGTIMLRCQPGAVLPAHDHNEDEHIVVILGDFVVGGRSYGPGDYHSSPKGNAHGDAFTRGGCLLLVQYTA